jgi:hypothetical protein
MIFFILSLQLLLLSGFVYSHNPGNKPLSNHLLSSKDFRKSKKMFKHYASDNPEADLIASKGESSSDSPVRLRDYKKFPLFPSGDELDQNLFKLLFPAILNFAIIPLVGAADTFYVGRMKNALALAGQVMQTINSLILCIIFNHFSFCLSMDRAQQINSSILSFGFSHSYPLCFLQ